MREIAEIRVQCSYRLSQARGSPRLLDMRGYLMQDNNLTLTLYTRKVTLRTVQWPPNSHLLWLRARRQMSFNSATVGRTSLKTPANANITTMQKVFVSGSLASKARQLLHMIRP